MIASNEMIRVRTTLVVDMIAIQTEASRDSGEKSPSETVNRDTAASYVR